MFRNNNPDKGTETMIEGSLFYAKLCLEIITPIRGRKLIVMILELIILRMFRNNNPDKGTETS